ncbi:MAG: peptidylprolyl isomerase [Thermodesulfobacteriota bacterium]
MRSAQLRRNLIPLFSILATLLLASPLMAAEKGKKAAAPAKATAAATVNGEAISAATVQSEIDGILQRAKAQGQTPPEAELEKIRQAVLDKLIKMELLHQESKKAGITVDNAAVDTELAGYKKGFPDDKAFAEVLAKSGLSEAELKRQIGRNQVIQKLIETRFKPKAQATEPEAKEFYDKNQEKFKQPDLVRARHILLTVKEGESAAEKDKKREKMKEIKKQLKDGGDFAALAKQYSDCPSKERGGDLGFFAKGQMVKPFEDAAFALKQGELSDIVETQFGFHIIKAEEKKAARTVGFDEAKERILGFLGQDKLNKTIDAFLADARAKADVKVNAPAQPKK